MNDVYTDADGNFALQIVAKPLQIAAQYYKSYRNLSAPYPTVPYHRPYDRTYRLTTIQHLINKHGRTTERKPII